MFSTAYLFGHIILMAAGCEKDILKATIAGAVVNCILNLILIPGFKQSGAAIASVCAEIVVTAVLLLQARHYFRINIEKNYVISILFSLAVMTSVNLVEINVLDGSFVNTMIIIASAVAVYGGMLIITRNDVVEKY